MALRMVLHLVLKTDQNLVQGGLVQKMELVKEIQLVQLKVQVKDVYLEKQMVQESENQLGKQTVQVKDLLMDKVLELQMVGKWEKMMGNLKAALTDS
jgi:hypothetical protein